MSNFVNAMSVTTTDNGATTLRTSGSKCVDLFGQAGSIRAWETPQVEKIFADAFKEDPLTATKIAFYLRDVRGGQGERKTFRTITHWLANNYPEVLSKNLEHIPFYGRYDDLLEVFYRDTNKELSTKVLSLVKSQLVEDLKSENPSLLAKWCASTNTSSKETRNKGFKLANALKLNNKKYRKTLSLLRSRINIVEAKMCSNNWNEINYSHVPSRASNLYKNAFRKHDPEGYEAFVGAVEKGEAKVNAGTLYPYEIVAPLMNYCSDNDKREAEIRWNALPDYVEGNERAIVVADTSGSMSGDPINVAVSLAIYMAERNVGDFKDCWINFSDNPTFQMLKGNTLAEKIGNMDRHNWDSSTNFVGVFEMILARAKASNLSYEDFPSAVIVVSDMQFNSVGGREYETSFEYIKSMYQDTIYKMPNLVFWNVDSHAGQSPVSSGEKGTALISGFSPTAFKIVASLDDSVTPYGIMMKAINDERYDRVTV
jgi:hypothetical protein